MTFLSPDTSPYYFLQTHKSGWRDALDHCRSLDMDLPTFSYYPTVIDSAEINSFWIGLFLDRWAWSDESPTSLRYWMVGRPANLQGCAVVSVTDQGRWYEEQCETEMPFVCQGGEFWVSTAAWQLARPQGPMVQKEPFFIKSELLNVVQMLVIRRFSLQLGTCGGC